MTESIKKRIRDAKEEVSTLYLKLEEIQEDIRQLEPDDEEAIEQIDSAVAYMNEAEDALAEIV